MNVPHLIILTDQEKFGFKFVAGWLELFLDQFYKSYPVNFLNSCLLKKIILWSILSHYYLYILLLLLS